MDKVKQPEFTLEELQLLEELVNDAEKAEPFNKVLRLVHKKLDTALGYK